MTNLHSESCVACRTGAERLSGEALEARLLLLPEWRLVERDGITVLSRTFSFSSYPQALEFTQQVGAMAEREGHHPAMLTEWGKVTVYWWTHKIAGLHHNDCVCAAKTDHLFTEYPI